MKVEVLYSGSNPRKHDKVRSHDALHQNYQTSRRMQMREEKEREEKKREERERVEKRE